MPQGYSLADELARLKALQRYAILDTPSEEAFDRLTLLATRLFNVPISTITLVDRQRVWFKSKQGLAFDEAQFDHSLCYLAHQTGELFYVPDARLDSRTADNKTVKDNPKYCFYAAYPLKTSDGHSIGVFCIADYQPRTLTEGELDVLKQLADLVMDGLELRLNRLHLAETEAALRRIGQAVTGTSFTQSQETIDRQSRYLALLHQTAVTLLNRLDVDELLQIILKQAAQLLSTENNYIATLTPGGKTMSVKARLSLLQTGAFIDEFKPGEGAGGQVWATGHSLAIADYRHWSGRLPHSRYDALRATVAFPLKANQQVIGVIVLSHLEEGRGFDDESLEYLERFVQLASLALANAELQAASQRSLAELATVQRVAQAINSTLQLDKLFDLVVQQITQAFDYKMVSIYLLKDNVLELQAYKGYDHITASIPLDTAIAGRVASSGQAAFVREAASDPDFASVIPGTQQAIIVPVKSPDGRVLATLLVESTGQPVLVEQDLVLLQLLADQIGVAMENAWLFVELSRSEARYRDVVDNAKEIIYQLDTKGEWVFLNNAWEKLLGYDIADTLKTHPLKYIHPDDLAQVAQNFSRVNKLSLDNLPSPAELRFICADGSTRWFEANGRPMLSANGELLGYSGTLIDITQRKQAEQERLDWERKVLESQKLESLGVLAGGIAHDFNNLLVPILGNAELALGEIQPGSVLYESLLQIEQASRRAANLVRQMLDYSGKGRFLPQRHNLNGLVEDMQSLLQISVAKNVSLHINLSLVSPFIIADAAQIRQAVLNLVINASEAIGLEQGTIKLNTGITDLPSAYLAKVYADPDLPPGQYVYLEVCDTGSGMDEAVQSRIFDPFFTTKFTGRGLGLPSVLGIVRSHKGALTLESAPGVGTTIRILLAQAAAVAVPPPLVKPGSNTSKKRILVVDDEDWVLNVMERALRRFGYEVATASDGLIGIELFQKADSAFDCVLLDMTMPHMNGKETFEALRQLQPDLPIILMSGYSEQEAAESFEGGSLAGFVQKPFALNELLETIKKATQNFV